ncbi:enoyl-CoA hydratase-related protein [Paracoccus sp. (in: a-proteobacteria)]|uniref:enoyl-CoA hydratase-related protein n=1 Tax=Paracoccus sp. TaxID=267 RepID=UPI00289F2069|nr:enoyl-CoA hydratase-related protein [Paracoccus sp. (in: a-proteobacteria)]
MSYQTIDYSQSDGVAVITLDRPDVMNALNARMRGEITQAMTGLGSDVRCAVITGRGRAFCSGQDLADASQPVDLEKILRDEYEPMLWSIRQAPVPVIAAVNGMAAGAGASLALAADVVIAAQSAAFMQAFTRIGLMPDAGGTYALPRSVGLARAAGMMLFADKISADQAADWGMIWEAVPDAEFDGAVMARAMTLAQGPTQAFLAVREALAASASNDLQQQLELEARLQGALGKSRDFSEGVSAFIEKRPARFTGN